MKHVLYYFALLLSTFFISCNGQQDSETTMASEKKEIRSETDVLANAVGGQQTTINLSTSVQAVELKNPVQLIAGTWLSEEDSNWKLVFSADGTCRQYYQEDLLETDSFTVSNTSPQCGEEVHVDSTTNYLRLENIENNEQTCYQLNSINEDIMTLRPLTSGGLLVFTKQK